MNEGDPVIQDYLVSNISVTNMHGYTLPEYNYN